MSKTKIIIAVIVLLAIAGIVFASVRSKGKEGMPVALGKVERADIVSKVSSNGRIDAKRKVDLSAHVMGQIVNLAVREGDVVAREHEDELDHGRSPGVGAGSAVWTLRLPRHNRSRPASTVACARPRASPARTTDRSSGCRRRPNRCAPPASARGGHGDRHGTHGEPHVNRQVFESKLAEAPKVRVRLRTALTSVEFDLLKHLLMEAGKIIKKEDLSLRVLDRELSPFDRSLDMHISNLRKKLGHREDGSERIKTVRSVGYIYTLV